MSDTVLREVLADMTKSAGEIGEGVTASNIAQARERAGILVFGTLDGTDKSVYYVDPARYEPMCQRYKVTPNYPEGSVKAEILHQVKPKKSVLSEVERPPSFRVGKTYVATRKDRGMRMRDGVPIWFWSATLGGRLRLPLWSGWGTTEEAREATERAKRENGIEKKEKKSAGSRRSKIRERHLDLVAWIEERFLRDPTASNEQIKKAWRARHPEGPKLSDHSLFSKARLKFGIVAVYTGGHNRDAPRDTRFDFYVDPAKYRPACRLARIEPATGENIVYGQPPPSMDTPTGPRLREKLRIPQAEPVMPEDGNSSVSTILGLVAHVREQMNIYEVSKLVIEDGKPALVERRVTATETIEIA